MKIPACNIIIILALGISLASEAATYPNRFTTNSDYGAVVSSGLNQIPSAPFKLFILGDSKSQILSANSVSNQWPLFFTNLPYWAAGTVFFTNCADNGATIVEVTNQYHSITNLFAPPSSGTNNIVIIRDGANDFPTNSSVPWWINIYSNMLSDIQTRTNTFSCVWDIQPRTDHPDTSVFNRDAMNQALRRLTNWNFFVKSEDLIPNAALSDLLYDGVHENTNGAVAEALLCDRSIRLGPQHAYDQPKSSYERATLGVGIIAVQTVASFAFNTTYSNTNAYPIQVRVNYKLANAAVSGTVSFNGYVNGTASATRGFDTTASIPADTAHYGDMSFTVPAFGNYALTNSSTGTGNTVTLFGGQITFY